MQGGQLRGRKVVHELLSGTVHLGAAQQGKAQVLGYADDLEEIGKLLIRSAGSEITIRNDVEDDGSAGAANLDQFLDCALPFGGAVQPGESGQCVALENELVHLGHLGKGTRIRLNVSGSPFLHGLGSNQISHTPPIGKILEFIGHHSQLVRPKGPQGSFLRVLPEGLTGIGQAKMSLGGIALGSQGHDVLLIIQSQRIKKGIHPFQHRPVPLLGSSAHAVQKDLSLLRNLNRGETGAHVVTDPRLSGGIDHPVRKFRNEYPRLDAHTRL